MPFEGPLASVRIGRVEGQLIVFPTQDQLEVSDLDLIISGGEIKASNLSIGNKAKSVIKKIFEKNT